MKIAVSSATAASERSPPDLLADRTHGDLDPGRQRRVGVGERDAAGSSRKEDREDLAEGDLRVLERLEEDGPHPLVELLDDGREILSGTRQIVELIHEEFVTLLERGELLQRQRPSCDSFRSAS